VPFRTLTKEEESVFRKKWLDLKGQSEAPMKQWPPRLEAPVRESIAR
jgi:hypothetical protein